MAPLSAAAPGPRVHWPLLLAALAAGWLLHGRLSPRLPQSWAPPELKPSDFIDGIPVAREELRLVVGVMDVSKGASAESSKRLFGLDLGTTRVSVSVPARVHFALDLSGDEPVEFRLDRRRRSLTAVFPDPEVQAVEVFSAAKRVTTEAGWGRLSSRSGRALEDALDRGLPDALRREASAPAVLAQVRERARPQLARLLATYLKRAGALGPEGFWAAKVRFRGEPGDEAPVVARTEVPALSARTPFPPAD
ncbi:MAG: DUF4230 domain-containing protein [Elusimicrobia bacterium]|nr:DUF4230 domain-containing protein [Elusimicrobiota bacterium]